MGEESTIGPTERSMTVNGKQESKMAMACGGAFLGTATSANGRTARRMAMAFTNGKTATGSRVAGLIVSSMVKVQIYSQTVTSTLGIMLLESQTAKVCTNGRMDRFTKVNSKTV